MKEMMRWLYKLPLRLRSLFRKSRVEQDLSEELHFHLEKLTEEKVGQGMSAKEARYAALRELGGMEQIKEECRDMRRVSYLENFLQDVHFGLRQLRRNPGLTAVIILSLALGIGANTAIFSLIDAVMLQTLPVKQPGQIVLLNWVTQGWPTFLQSMSGNWDHDKTGRTTSTSFSYPVFDQIRALNSVFSGVCGFADRGRLNVGVDGQAGMAEAELVSGDFFSTLRVEPILGRTFTLEDDRAQASPVAVISFGYWERRFGHDARVIGKSITVNGVPFSLLGVAPPQFFGVQPGRSVDIYLPLSTEPQVDPARSQPGESEFEERSAWWVLILGRLKPGVPEEQARAGLDVILRQNVTADAGASLKAPAIPHIELSSASKGLNYLRQEFSRPLYILMAVVGLVLLIACANVAKLLLARATTRQREIAVRLALGAGRQRLVRQLLTESVLLSVLGGIAGLVLAFWASHLLVVLISRDEPIYLHVSPDVRVLGFTLLVSLLTGILFGLAPALRSTRVNLTPALKEGAKSWPGQNNRFAHLHVGLGKALVVSQIALSLLLLVGAGLFVRTLENLENIRTGFNARNLLLMGLDPTQAGYTGERLESFYENLHERLSAIPGVQNASLSSSVLVSGGESNDVISIPGYSPQPADGLPNGTVSVHTNGIGDGFFETMGIPLLLGQTLNPHDIASSSNLAVVNEAFARKFFGNSNPVGRHFTSGSASSKEVEIVGVVQNAKYTDLRQEVPPTVYYSYAASVGGLGAMNFEVRTAGNPKGWTSAVRDAVQAIDKGVPLLFVKTQTEQIDQTLLQERLFAKLTSFFSLLALVLACIGLYGVISYMVVQRSHEIGIRMALGAERDDVLKMVIGNGIKMTLIGVGFGIVGALALTRFLSSLLFGVRPTDAGTFVVVTLVLVGMALFACYLPARRATKVDPMVALRYE
jgi:predicted permease